MITIGVIKQNGVCFDDAVDKDQVITAVHDLIEFRDINFNDMMEFIVTELGMTKDTVGCTTTCYEDAKSVYQICHLSMKDNGKEDDESTFNYLSSCMTIGKVKVHGTAIMLKSKVSDNYTCIPDSISHNDVIDLLLSLIHI